MAIEIIGNANKQFVDAFHSAQALLYDAAGNVLVESDRGVLTPGVSAGMPAMGADYKTARLGRVSPDGSIRTNNDQLVFNDNVEGAAINTNKWIQAVTTMTITQNTGVILLNAGSSVATTVGAQLSTHRFFIEPMRGGKVLRARIRTGQHFNNNLHEIGFGSPANATSASIVNGAVWRKDGSGQWLPVIVSNSGTDILGTPISNATWLASFAATDWFVLEVVLYDTYGKFSAYTQTGDLAFEQTLEFGTTTQGFSQTALQGLIRNYNAAATGTAVQLSISDVSINTIDKGLQRPFNQLASGMGDSVLVSPTAYTQIANYANSAAPTSAVLSNAAAGYTTLGGQFQFAAVAGAETDFALFAVAIPTPKHFYFTGIRISTFNNVAAVGATATVLQWGLGFNSSAVSLATAAPYSYMRQTIGTQVFPSAAPVGFVAADVVWNPSSPICVMPSRFISVILKVPVGLATATEIFRGTVVFDGYFE